MRLGQMIKDKRTDIGMPQEELAKRIGCKQPLICKWESGKIIPSIDQVKKLEEVLGLGVLSKDFVEETFSK